MIKPVLKDKSVTLQKYAILFIVDDSSAYVKWTRHYGSQGHTHWDITPVHSFDEATHYTSESLAKLAIRRTPQFNGRDSVTAITVTE